MGTKSSDLGGESNWGPGVPSEQGGKILRDGKEKMAGKKRERLSRPHREKKNESASLRSRVRGKVEECKSREKEVALPVVKNEISQQTKRKGARANSPGKLSV